MREKIIGIFIMTLFIGISFLPFVIGNINYNENVDKKDIIHTISSSNIDSLDQHQDDFDPGGGSTVNSIQKFAQSFKPTVTVLTKVDLVVCGSPSVETGSLFISIRDNLDGSILTSISVPHSDIIGNLWQLTWNTFNFPNVTVIPENTYFIQIESNDGQFVLPDKWNSNGEDPYDRGNLFVWREDSQGNFYWRSEDHPTDSYHDCAFRTYGTDMNMVVTGEPEYVAIDDSDPDCWVNDSTMWEVEIDIFGEEHDDCMNASIQVTGCGLDFTIDEDDEIDDSDYLIYKDWGHYVVKISPKTGETLTITATNSTDEKSVSKDFEVKGLVGYVTTSIGDDKQITVDREERIIFTVYNAYYAEVHLNLFDEDWVWIEQLNMTEGDNTEGNGDDGIYEFIPDAEYLGHIVLAAKAGYGANVFYTYDMVEVVPALAEIKQVTGGLGVKATIAAVDIDCDWTINVKANFLLSGGAANGTIQAGTEETVQLPFTIALGKVTITVTATDIQKDYTAFALGPFFLNLEEI